MSLCLLHARCLNYFFEKAVSAAKNCLGKSSLQCVEASWCQGKLLEPPLIPSTQASNFWSQSLCCVKAKGPNLETLLHQQWRWQHIVTSFDPPGLHFRVLAPIPTIRDFWDSNYSIRRLTRATSLQATSDYSWPPVSKRARSSITIASSPLPAPRLNKRCSKRRR